MARENEKVAPITPQQVQSGRVDFVRDDFDTLIRQKGLLLDIDKAVSCPCRTPHNGHADPNCINCKSHGWVFLSQNEQTYGVIQGINKDPKFFQHSVENLGVAMLTVTHSTRLAWMDKITIAEGSSIFSETVYPSTSLNEGVLKAYLIYEPISVEQVWVYRGVDTDYECLSDGQYIIDGQELVITDAVDIAGGNLQVSIRYEHRPQYYVMDINHDIRNTPTLQEGIKEVVQRMPVHATIKKLHLIDA